MGPAPVSRTSQDVRSRNLPSVFYLMPVHIAPQFRDIFCSLVAFAVSLIRNLRSEGEREKEREREREREREIDLVRFDFRYLNPGIHMQQGPLSQYYEDLELAITQMCQFVGNFDRPRMFNFCWLLSCLLINSAVPQFR